MLKYDKVRLGKQSKGRNNDVTIDQIGLDYDGCNQTGLFYGYITICLVLLSRC
jgi:hypothetical protein